MVKLIVCGVAAQVENLVWSCDDGDTLKLLKHYMPFFDTGPQDPHPDLHAAEFVVEKLGGKVIDAGDAPEHVKGRIY